MAEQQQQQLGCCARLLAEWRLGMWSTVDVNGKTIDMEATFRPRAAGPAVMGGLINYLFLIKLGFLVWTTVFTTTNLLNYDVPSFWIVYLSNFSVMLVILYHALSLSCMVLPVGDNVMTKVAWGMFACAANVEAVVAILYWTLEYEGQAIEYASWMKHGILMLTVWIDGFLINRIPLRFKQFIWFWIVAALYIVWTGIHAAADIGNPRKSDNDPETDDDAIYGAVNWNQRPATAAISVVVILFLLTPIVWMFTWLLSTLGRRYVDYAEGQESKNEAIDDDSPGSALPHYDGATDVEQNNAGADQNNAGV